MNYNAFIFEGHGTSEITGGYDPGAVAQGYKENDLADAIVKAAQKYIEPTGLNIHYDENNYTDKDLEGNTYINSCGIVVHVNAGGGTRSEIYVPCREKFLDSDFDILKDLEVIGLKNGGVKSRDYDSEQTFIRSNGQPLSYSDYYGEIRDAWGRGISLAILEVGFIDSSDLGKIVANIDYIGWCVAKYIASNCNKNITPYTTSKPDNNSGSTSNEGELFFRVVCGSFKNRDLAEKRKKELEAAGFTGAFLDAFRK